MLSWLDRMLKDQFVFLCVNVALESLKDPCNRILAPRGRENIDIGNRHGS